MESGEFRKEDAHPALVTRPLFMAVQAKREQRAVVHAGAVVPVAA